MIENILIDKKGSSIEEIPDYVDILAVRQFSEDELERRTRRLLYITGETCKLNLERGDWVRKENRTLVQLPKMARIVIYNASGVIHFVTGLSPMEHLFEKVDRREELIKLIVDMGERLSINNWIPENDKLSFERLWQIKAAAADSKGNMIDPVLCRIVGAYRHFVNDIPVWGPASVAIKLAGGSQLDSLTVHVRESTGKVIDQVKIIDPEQAARQIMAQVNGLIGQKDIRDTKGIKPSYFEFGYLSLPKRKVQRVLAPVFIAGVEIHNEEAQAYQMIVPASEREFLTLCRSGNEVMTNRQRK